jgi:hypothetical protein
MEWLSQNWIWVVAGIGVVWLLSRSRHGGLMGGCGAHGMAHEGPAGEAKGQGAVPRPSMKQESAERSEERTTTAHRHGRGGCC